MSYQAIDQLINDPTYNGRVRACATQQAEVFKDDQRADFVALSDDILRGVGDPLWAFIRISAAGPGIGDKVDNGDGTIDQAKVTDADLLSLVQGNWQTVAALFFAADGTPLKTEV
jgi:hypothetical protein